MKKILKILRPYSSIWLTILLISLSPISAEDILLKNGVIVSGRIVGQSSSDLEIDTGAGVRRFPKSQVVKVQYKAFTPE
jgi:hypothetical protein